MSESGIVNNFFPVAKGRDDRDLGDVLCPENDIVQRIENGEEAAFEEFYRQFSPLVHGIVLARVPYSDAEDLVQEVFLSAYRSIGKLRDRKALGPWLSTIARNRSSEYYRKRKQTDELHEDIEHIERPSAEASEALRAILSLPDTYKETLVLRLVEGMTGPEIADLTGLQPASVRVNLHRGMKMLRKKLGIGQKEN